MRKILRPFLFLAALVFLFEAWVWDRLSPVVAWIVSHVFWKKLRDAVSAGIEKLPPYATLFVFAVPVLLLLPFKIAALWLLTNGHWAIGGLVFMLAKVVGVAIAAFLFRTCQPKLMQIPWFTRLYAAVMRARDWAHRIVDPYKEQIRAAARRIKARIRATLPRGGWFGRALRRLRYRAWRVFQR